jgi:lipid-A-disaccharide synthase
MQSRLIYLIAGEPSGDAIGARLMSALARRNSASSMLLFRGVGGTQMCADPTARAAPRMCSLFPMAELSVMGLAEIVPRLFALRARLRETINDVVASRPACVVCIDSKGFSSRVMRGVRERLGAQTPPLVQYVAPSAWAYRDGERRARAYRTVADHVLLLLPFERHVWDAAGVPNTVVGHPAVEIALEMANAGAARAAAEPCCTRGRADGKLARTLGLMAGSRASEVEASMRLLPDAVRELRARAAADERVELLFITAPDVDARTRALVHASGLEARIVVNDSPAALRAALDSCDAVASVSGTAVLQLALSGTPAVAFYRASLLTELGAQLLARVHHVSIPNLIVELDPSFAAQRPRLPLIPEVLFSRCTPRGLADALAPLMLGDGAAAARAAQLEAVAPVRHHLLTAAQPRPSELAADAIMRLLRARAVPLPADSSRSL